MTAKQKTKLLSRKIRRQNRQVMQNIGEHFDVYIVEQFAKLRHIRRPVIAWLLLVIFLGIGVFVQTRQLSAYYIDEVPISGGVLKEGMVGEVTNFNPLYITSSADASLSELMFSSLTKYDSDGDVVGDLAKRWTTNSTGTVYTVELRKNAYWHDGEQVTADDVVFTFDMLQHPDTDSPLLSSWQGVSVKKINNYKVSINLPNAFAPLPDSLTAVGIIPEHILKNVNPEQLRGNKFNLIEPVGSGPFVYSESISLGNQGDEESVLRFKLLAHKQYHFNKPRLDGITLYVYSDREQMVEAFNNGELALADGLFATDIDTSRFVSDSANDISAVTLPQESTVEFDSANVHSGPRTAGVFLFLNNTDDLFKDRAVRRALSYGISRGDVIEHSDGLYYALRSPLLSSHLGYSDKYLQPNYDKKKAERILNNAGWKLADDGYRYKKKTKLEFSIVSQADDIYPEVVQTIQENLAEIGVSVVANIITGDRIQQDFLAEHNYQALLFGIEMGHDPDQFAFWHSSQRGLYGRNLANYKSSIVDIALEAGRTRLNTKLRVAKYEAFLKQWIADAPSIALYQPSYTYTNKKQVRGINIKVIDREADRYHNVHKWTINIGEAEKNY